MTHTSLCCLWLYYEKLNHCFRAGLDLISVETAVIISLFWVLGTHVVHSNRIRYFISGSYNLSPEISQSVDRSGSLDRVSRLTFDMPKKGRGKWVLKVLFIFYVTWYSSQVSSSQAHRVSQKRQALSHKLEFQNNWSLTYFPEVEVQFLTVCLKQSCV